MDEDSSPNSGLGGISKEKDSTVTLGWRLSNDSFKVSLQVFRKSPKGLTEIIFRPLMKAYTIS